MSAAVAVPHNSRLVDNYGPVYGEPQILSRSYEEPRYISAPVYAKSYAEPRYVSAPVYAKSYAEPRYVSAPVYAKSYGEPQISYGGPQILTKAYGAEPAYGKSYTTGVSTQYSIRHDAPVKSYAQPIVARSYAAPVLTKAYAQPVLTKAYAQPILTRSYEAPLLTKSYGGPIVSDYNLEGDYGYGYGKAY